MLSRLTEDLNHEIAGTIGNTRLAGESWFRGNEDADSDNPLYMVEITIESLLSGSKAIDGTYSGPFSRLFRTACSWNCSCTGQGSILEWDLTADKKQITGPLRCDITRNRLWSFWKNDTQLFELLCDL